MFHSIETIMLTVVFLSIILPSLILRRSPLLTIKVAFSKLIRDKKMLLHFVALFLILYLNKIEQKFSTELLLGDYTPIISYWEGNIVYYIQNIFLNYQLTYMLTFFYIIAFPTLMVSSVIIYLNRDDYKSFYAFVYALMLNYGIVIPFFLFFPVFEVWYYDPNVNFLIPQIYPNFELEYRPMSGIDNNFPSLHTSISVTIALIALKSKDAIFRKVASISAVIIVFSTIYLGIHWLADMAAGILLASIVSLAGLRISEYSYNDHHLHIRNYISK